MEIKSIGVFCGSSVGANPIYGEAAQLLGRLMAEAGQTLVYGAGKVGLMGIIADAVLEKGGRAIGVIPDFLMSKELAHENLSELKVVANMSERKILIGELSDAYIAMPGGFGTLDEVMEVLTYFQLGISEKPVGFLNVNGYYDALLSMFDKILEERFMKYEHRHNVIVRDNPEELLQAMHDFKPLAVDEKWIEELKQRKTY